MKTCFLPHRRQLAPLVLIALVSIGPSRAASEPPAVVANPAASITQSTQAPARLAWDRVGSPLQIRA